MKGQVFRLLGGPVFIFGRYAKATFNLAADPAASHLHFLIDTSEDRVRVADLGSTNGLVINERHIGGKLGAPYKDFVSLNAGDTLLAGSSLFRLIIDDENTTSLLIEEKKRSETAATRLPAIKSGNLTTVLSKEEKEKKDSEKEGTVDITEHVKRALPQIEGFSIIGRIAGGGKGVVYKAVKNDTGVTAAIKMMIFNRNKSKKQRSLEMFRREIQITKQLDHPNIIRYIDDGISQGLPYLALEYVDGGNLDDMIRRREGRRVELDDAIPLFIQLLEAVSYMHQRCLVHRDIKPKNILLDVARGGGVRAKLSDMGLSCRFSNEDNDDFLPIVCEGGTPAYMPPEQLTDLTRAIPQSDVFSSAATLYQMLTGSLLYDFTDKEQNATILEGNIKPILYLRPDLPLAIANVVSKGLSYNPENRYADAQEMLDAFNKALV